LPGLSIGINAPEEGRVIELLKIGGFPQLNPKRLSYYINLDSLALVCGAMKPPIFF